MALANPLYPIINRSRDKRRNLWVGWCCFILTTLVYSINYIHTVYHTLNNQSKLFQETHTYQKIGAAMMVCWMIWHCYSSLLGFKCIFQFLVRDSLYHNMDIGSMCRCALASCTLSQSIRLFFFMCAVLVLIVIMCTFYYFLDRVLFYHDFHHDSCDCYRDFYGNSFHFELQV